MPSFFERFLARPVPGLGLGLLRVLLALVMAAEVAQLIYFKSMVFDAVPFLEPRGVWIQRLLPLWIPVLLCLALGYRTRVFAAINLVACFFTFGAFHTFEYHVDYVYSGASLLLVVSPVGASLSIDGVRRRVRAAVHAPEPGPAKVAIGWYFAWVFLGLALIYVDSIFHKLASPMWLGGLGLWLPASLPQNTWLPTTALMWLLNERWLVLTLGYVTVAFEFSFVVLMWFRRPRALLFIIGLGLHVGIFIAFPIPWFALAEVAVYVALMPLGWFRVAARLLRPRHGHAVVELSPDDVGARRVGAFLRSIDAVSALRIEDGAPSTKTVRTRLLDGSEHVGEDGLAMAIRALPGGFLLAVPLRIPAVRRALYGRLTQPGPSGPARSPSQVVWSVRGLVVLLLLSTLVQAHHIACYSPVGKAWMKRAGLDDDIAGARDFSAALTKATRRAAGLVPHPVFMDFHFRDYNHIVAVQYAAPNGTRQWLPIVRPTGQASWYTSGRQWVYWTFRSNSRNVSNRKLESGIRRYTAFWAKQNGVSLDDASFHIVVKKIRAPFAWEEDLLQKNVAAPWHDVGTAQWQRGRFTARLTNIEQL